jgi:hypothetical protein
MPTFPPVLVELTLSLAPDRKLLGGLSWDCALKPPVRPGRQAVRACSMAMSWSCGLMRSTCTPRFCSSASWTASATVN